MENQESNMISKDGSIVIYGAAMIHPSLNEAIFLESSLGRNAERGIFNAGYHTYHTLGVLENKLECSLSVIFYQGTLDMVVMAPRWPGLTSLGWSNWSFENELEIKRKNDVLLEQSLGTPPYHYEWGSVSSEYDAKTGDSSITISYGRKQA